MQGSAAQDFPTRPFTIVLPVPPGGIVDMAARLASEHLTQALGQSVVVDKRAGASGNIAYGNVPQAAPEAFTLLASYSMYPGGHPSMFSNSCCTDQSFTQLHMLSLHTITSALIPPLHI